jgi:hypothetical protein
MRFLGWVLMSAAGMVLLAASLTVLFLGMRDVMDVGGACASGQTGYEIAVECPDGAWSVPVAIFAGLIGLGIHAWGATHLPGPRWLALAWPALFLSLGWNFWEYGLDPPQESGMGTMWGWVVCGALFVLMGGLPLLGALGSSSARRRLFWSDAPPHVTRTRITAAELAVRNPDIRFAGRTAAEALGGRPAGHSAPPAGDGGAPTGPIPAEPGPEDRPALTDDLERLAALHRRGDLSDEEFRAAKARLLEGELSP